MADGKIAVPENKNAIFGKQRGRCRASAGVMAGGRIAVPENQNTILENGVDGALSPGFLDLYFVRGR